MPTLDKRVVAGADDVEESAAGTMYLNSSDLELVDDAGSGGAGQKVGVRFTGIEIPQGAIITSAYIQFQTDEVGSAAASLLIRGDDSNDAAAFTSTLQNVSSRLTTDASVAWSPAAWSTVGQAGIAQRTPDLSAIVQEIVSRGGWTGSATSDMAFIITGTGRRTAEAFESGAATAPLLHIEWVLPTGNAPPVIDLDGSAAGTGYAGIFAENLGGVAIAAAGALITDADNTQMQRLTATLTNARAGDQLTVNAAGLPAGITVDAASTATNVILTGAASTAAYQTAVQQILFNNTSETPDPTARVINVTVSDGIASSAPAVATIAIDRAPDAVGDTATTVLNTAVTTVNVLANDDQGDAPATIVAFDAIGTGGGTVVSNGNGTFTYTPGAGFTGADSFTYTIADSDGDQSTAVVAVTVTTANAPPVIDLDGSAAGTGYAGTFAENLGGVAIAAAGALITDADSTQMQRLTATLTNARAGDQLTVNVAGLPAGITVDATSTATNVILTGAASTAAYQTAVQQILFNNTSETPDPTPRVINVTVSDGIASSAPAVATIAVDRAPDAVGDTATTVLNTAVTTVNVLANDDQGDAPATIVAFDAIGTGGGTVVSNGNGTFTYTPGAGFTGADSFTYTIADSDGDQSTAAVAVTVTNLQAFTLDKRVVAGADDVEQSASGVMSLASSDLELVDDAGSIGQSVGLRFTGLGIPQGAIITSAYIQFQTDEVSPAVASLLVRGENVNDAAAFTASAQNVSSRATTSASVAWTPPAWSTVGQAGLAQRTPDLAVIVQEIVNRAGWTGSATSDMAFIITGTGRRTAEAFESGAATAPLLHIEYSAIPPPPPPLAVLVADGTPSPQVEGATARISFTINLSTPTTENVLLTYSTANGTAAAGSDFVGVVNGQATIIAGSTSTTVLVDLLDDTTAENAEAFTLVVGSARGVTSGSTITIADAVGAGNIADNDGTPGVPSVVAIRDTRALGSPDPSGLAYVPSLGTLFLSDSEVEETPFSRSNNLFALNLDGTLKPNGAISLLGFTDEPTGLAFDPFTGHLVISDDDRFSIYRVDPANPTVKLGEFATNSALLRVIDPEDVAVNPTNGHVFITNGTGNSSAGGPLGRAIVETNSTGTQLFSSISLPSVIDDPEALAYDAAHDVFFVGGGFSSSIWVVNRAGGIVATLNILSNFRNPISDTSVAVKDLELAPSSNPNDNPATMSLYVADYGVAHASSANDGRLFEISDPFWFV